MMCLETSLWIALELVKYPHTFPISALCTFAPSRRDTLSAQTFKEDWEFLFGFLKWCLSFEILDPFRLFCMDSIPS